MTEGLDEATTVGDPLGNEDGSLELVTVGIAESETLGNDEGSLEAVTEGLDEPATEGELLGNKEGD